MVALVYLHSRDEILLRVTRFIALVKVRKSLAGDYSPPHQPSRLSQSLPRQLLEPEASIRCQIATHIPSETSDKQRLSKSRDGESEASKVSTASSHSQSECKSLRVVAIATAADSASLKAPVNKPLPAFEGSRGSSEVEGGSSEPEFGDCERRISSQPYGSRGGLFESGSSRSPRRSLLGCGGNTT